jgi:peptidyl-prolyl cis-trans isomerase C
MVKKRVLIFLGFACLSGLLLLRCEKIKGKDMAEKELVRINDSSLSLEEFHQITDRLSLEGKMKLLSEKGMRDFLENYVITREVLFQEAKKEGFDRNERILSKVEDFKRALVIDALLEEALQGKTLVSDEEVQQYYSEHKDQFTEPEEVRIRHIFVNSEATLREVLTRLSKGENFGKLASTYNVDKSREDGGNLGYIRRGQLAPLFAQFEEAAFLLKNRGNVSEVITTPYGFHIIQLDDKRGTVLRSLDQVKEKIRFFLQTKKKQDAYLTYVKETKSKTKITINEKLWAEEEKKGEPPEAKK